MDCLLTINLSPSPLAAAPRAQLFALRDKLTVVLRKTKNDDRLITALRAELGAAVSACRAAAAAGGADGAGAAAGAVAALQLQLRPSVIGAVAGGGADWAEVAQLRQQVVEQEEQLEQSAKVIRYLQSQVRQDGGGGGGAPASAGGSSMVSGGGGGGESAAQRAALLADELDAARDEVDELRAQVAALQDDLEQALAAAASASASAGARPGTSGLSSELRRQVLALEEENERLRAALTAARGDAAAARAAPAAASGGAGGRAAAPPSAAKAAGAAAAAVGEAAAVSAVGAAAADIFVVERPDEGAEDEGALSSEGEEERLPSYALSEAEARVALAAAAFDGGSAGEGA